MVRNPNPKFICSSICQFFPTVPQSPLSLSSLFSAQYIKQLRVAGGWVRDKLLGKECYDIDIALDNMLGSEFVDKVQKYLSSTGEVAQGLAVIPSFFSCIYTT
ncbi:hypothetical protein V6N12_000839 [Hibiscus sabdariffa]|uniref:Poly A polymerase head domain-containing protein n=1 Tax=Hibiscus sabdariffa TaxID=183260 RepID=A0ABR2BXJ1_9ROSI